MSIRQLCVALILVLPRVQGAVRPPPWADPKLNPCASNPRGWQYIYWPADGQCYKIFQRGYPCPDTMELVPAISKRRPRSVKAECQCPPASVYYEGDGRCHEIYKRGPCERGQYLAPQRDNATSAEHKLRLGGCTPLAPCDSREQTHWPLDGKCYRRHTRGPCAKGQLLDLGPDLVPVCTCSSEGDLRAFFWAPSERCYEHYTRGPCQEPGHLFLPDGRCDCHASLVHYHRDTQQCYELGTVGPCRRGHQFQLDGGKHAACQCKDGYVYWPADGGCYRPYTQGPCAAGRMLVNGSACVAQPCARGSLFFPAQQTCYRVGAQGPCPIGQVVVFDFRARPSLDGISYNGLCGCSGHLHDATSCLKGKRSADSCPVGTVMLASGCHKLYGQGPCPEGQWLVPNYRRGRRTAEEPAARCDCRPGYSAQATGNTAALRCLPPAVSLANYLNKHYAKQR